MFYTVVMKCDTTDDMIQLGKTIGASLRGGECIELVGDVGAGKTTLVKGIAEALQADDVVQSPSFTISREYACRDGIVLKHYDFYRLHEAGVMKFELEESLADPETVNVIEWASTIDAVLPEHRIQVHIEADATTESRQVTVTGLQI